MFCTSQEIGWESVHHSKGRDMMSFIGQCTVLFVNYSWHLPFNTTLAFIRGAVKKFTA